MKFLSRDNRKNNIIKIGWVVYESWVNGVRSVKSFKDVVSEIRCKNILLELNRHNRFFNEIYDSSKKYDLVVFVKVMDEECQFEVKKIKEYGGKVIFDANVNYFEIWGDYFIEGTKPTALQNKNSIKMASICDCVIGDSEYITKIASKYSKKTVCIPDSVDMALYSGQVSYLDKKMIRLIWSGVSKKSLHFYEIIPVLSKISKEFSVQLTLVSDRKPEIFNEISQVINTKWIKFSHRKYISKLLASDIIISPKRLINGYELGHTEYKITLGMALGLPAIASPQLSYVNALRYGGGIIASTETEWYLALRKLISSSMLREKMGIKAKNTVKKYYSLTIILKKYVDLFNDLLRYGE